MSDTLLKEVNLASDVKKYIQNSIVYVDKNKRKIIESTPDDEFLKISTENSFGRIRILDVELIDDTKLKNY